MIVAMIAVRMMQAPCDHVVDMIAVRHRLVPAPSVMSVIGDAVDRFRVAVRMARIHRDYMLIDVVAVRVMQMAIVEVVDVIAVTHRDVTTPLSVDVPVLAFMNGM